MIKTSEYCAVGHPDRMCDYIASSILDQYLRLDPNARVALEVQMKDAFCTISGEVTTKEVVSNAMIADIARDAICKIGYTDQYRALWGEGNVVSGSGIEVVTHISQQSRDIAQGVDNSHGWGDQGIFWGLAVDDPQHGNMPIDYWLARKIANELADSKIGGLDIKCLVSVESEKPIECFVAIPILREREREVKDHVKKYLHDVLGKHCNVVVNGTGRYVTHGTIGDCGTTGRKLVCDFYGGNSRIGGGSPWGKDPTKADVTLNILAREKALAFMRKYSLDEVRCAISCCIGRPEISIAFFDRNDNTLEVKNENCSPDRVIEKLNLRKPGYAQMCKEGLFGYE